DRRHDHGEKGRGGPGDEALRVAAVPCFDTALVRQPEVSRVVDRERKRCKEDGGEERRQLASHGAELWPSRWASPRLRLRATCGTRSGIAPPAGRRAPGGRTRSRGTSSA